MAEAQKQISPDLLDRTDKLIDDLKGEDLNFIIIVDRGDGEMLASFHGTSKCLAELLSSTEDAGFHNILCMAALSSGV